ncbi:MAG: hypothetical protein KM296_00555 [Brockia lithotrophica]|nr:hypothetical protein [Brockia lithotrophica]
MRAFIALRARVAFIYPIQFGKWQYVFLRPVLNEEMKEGLYTLPKIRFVILKLSEVEVSQRNFEEYTFSGDKDLFLEAEGKLIRIDEDFYVFLPKEGAANLVEFKKEIQFGPLNDEEGLEVPDLEFLEFSDLVSSDDFERSEKHSILFSKGMREKEKDE